MVSFNIKLADIPMNIFAEYDATMEFCSEYLTEEEPLFSVVVEQKNIDDMRERDMKTAEAEGRLPAVHSDRYLEKLALCRCILDKLINYNVVLFHGSVVAIDGRAYIFTAKSGTGKTTHTQLWLKSFPGSYVLNGDKPLLLFRDGRVYACGSPWRGKEKYGVNEILPLEAICILHRSERNTIEATDLDSSLPVLLNQCHIPDGGNGFLSAIGLLKRLSSVELYSLGCNTEDDAAYVSYNAMVK